MELTRVTDPADAARWQAVQARAYAHDYRALPADPIGEVLPLLGDQGAHGMRSELYLGVAGGRDVVAAVLELPTRDNLIEATLTLSVAPDARRRGHATAALAALEARCRELGRARLLAEVQGLLDGTRTAGQQFAARHGFASKLAQVRRVLDTQTVDDAALQALADGAQSYAEGYTLLSWADRAPAHLHAGLAALAGRMTLDAPMGELEREPEAWDAARWAAKEQSALDRGRLRLGTLAHRDGEVVAYTDFGINREVPEVGYQWDTIVRRDHRGHRLGTLVKVANLRQLRERSPGTRWVNTWNAASNTYMISINEAIGWRPVDSWAECEKSL